MELTNPAAQSGGAPMLPKQMTEVESRPGVDGVSVLLFGKKGVPFQMISGVDVDDREAAEEKLRAYGELSGQIVEVVWNGVNYTAYHNTKFVVLFVDGVLMKRLSAASGGLSTGKQFWVSAVWTLVGFDLESE